MGRNSRKKSSCLYSKKCQHSLRARRLFNQLDDGPVAHCEIAKSGSSNPPQTNIRPMKQTKKQPAALKSTGWGIPLAKRSLPRLVYLIELDPAVAADPAFAASNPGYVPGMPCYYAGSTSLPPQERYGQHISGSKNASRIVHKFGLMLRMDLVHQKGPIGRKGAIAKEVKLARDLREKGYGAWQA